MTLANQQLLDVFDHEVRQNAEWTRMRREVQPNLVRCKCGIKRSQ